MWNRFTLLAFVLIFSSRLVLAGSDTANLSVTATVVATCSTSTSAVDFGNYDPLSGTPNDSTGTVTVTCTNQTPYNIELNAGANDGGSGTGARKMLGGTNADTLSYQLYQDAGRTTIWGTVADGDEMTPLTGSGAAQNHTVYGRITINQNVSADTYTDTVVVKVNF